MQTLLPTADTLRALTQTAAELLDAAGVTEPPVDPLAIARRLQIQVLFDQQQQPRGRHTRIAGRPSIFVRPDERPERLNWAVAHELGESVAYRVFERLQVSFADVAPADREEVANLLASRLLLPDAWFLPDALACDGNIFHLKQRYATASHELIAWRLLDLPLPTIVSVFDQGRLSRRKCNGDAAARRLHRAEQHCWQQVHRYNRPHTVRAPGLAVQGWPIHEAGWQREVLRTTLAAGDDSD